MPRSVRFFTVGCKVNQYETQAVRESFLKNGYVESSGNSPADIFVINTCTVTSKADRDSRRLIHLAHRCNPGAEIVVTGCLTEKNEDDIRAIPGITHIIKNPQKHTIAQILQSQLGIACLAARPLASVAPSGPLQDSLRSLPRNDRYGYTPLEISYFHGRSRAFVKIQDGCSNLCSYCKVPYVRGRSRSRDLKGIIDEARRLITNGLKEIVLCGVCLGQWGRDLAGNLELVDVIDKIDSISGNFRIRLSSIEPNLVSDRLIKKMADSVKVCSHLHIPLQSGDERILKLMNRPYSARSFINIIERIKKIIPGISLTTDVLVGFPGEDKRNFSNTLKLLKKIKPSRMHIFPYSRREGTTAYNYGPSVPDNEIKERVKRLRHLEEKFSYAYRMRFLNKTVRILVEGKKIGSTSIPTGYTDTYIRAFMERPAPLPDEGLLIMARISKITQKSTFFTSLLTHP